MRSSEKRSRGVVIASALKPVASRSPSYREIKGQGGILHEARIGAVAPHLHAGGREVHVPWHVADRARLVLAQTRLAGASNLFQQSAEAGFVLLAKMMRHPAGAMEFADIDAHAVPVAPRHRQAQHILRQEGHAVGTSQQGDCSEH